MRRQAEFPSSYGAQHELEISVAEKIQGLVPCAERVAFSCSGSDCDGAALVLSTVAADHVEGYFSGAFRSDSGAGAASVVCSFYLRR